MANLRSDKKQNVGALAVEALWGRGEGRRERDIKKQNLQGRQVSKRQNPVVQCTSGVLIHVKACKLLNLLRRSFLHHKKIPP